MQTHSIETGTCVWLTWSPVRIKESFLLASLWRSTMYTPSSSLGISLSLAVLLLRPSWCVLLLRLECKIKVLVYAGWERRNDTTLCAGEFKLFMGSLKNESVVPSSLASAYMWDYCRVCRRPMGPIRSYQYWDHDYHIWHLYSVIIPYSILAICQLLRIFCSILLR